MSGPQKTETELIQELRALRARLEALERAELAHAQVEEALRAANERLEYLLAYASVAIYTAKPSGDYGGTSITGNVRRMTGYEPRDFTENSSFWIDHVHPEDRQHILDALPGLFEHGSHAYEYRFLHKDGTYRWMRDEMRLAGDEAGKPTEIVGYFIDITDRKRAEEALRKERDFSTSLLDASPAFFVGISAEGKTLMMNKAMLTTMGYTKQEVVGKSYLETFVPQRDRQLLAGVFDKLVHLREPTLNENRVQTRDGRELLVEWRGRPVFKEDGQFDFFFGVGIDVTERRRAEEEKAKVEAQLRHAHKMQAVGQLAAGVAHDFNSILTVILGNAERSLSKMKEMGVASAEADALRQIVSSVDRGAGLVRRLLAFGRAGGGKPQLLDLNRIVMGMETMLRPLIGGQTEFRVRTVPDIKPIYADVGQIEEVIMNLVLNARDAMPEGGRLTIKTAHVTLGKAYARTHIEVEPGSYTVLMVSDTGTGMDKETAQRMFEPFFTTKSAEKGSGLGLSIVHGIVTKAGGHIEVTSKPGKGTSFKLYFPVATQGGRVPRIGGNVSQST